MVFSLYTGAETHIPKCYPTQWSRLATHEPFTFTRTKNVNAEAYLLSKLFSPNISVLYPLTDDRTECWQYLICIIHYTFKLAFINIRHSPYHGTKNESPLGTRTEPIKHSITVCFAYRTNPNQEDNPRDRARWDWGSSLIITTWNSAICNDPDKNFLSVWYIVSKCLPQEDCTLIQSILFDCITTIWR